jgi:hypothetical protein
VNTLTVIRSIEPRPTAAPQRHPLGRRSLVSHFAVVAISGVTFDANGNPNLSNIHRDLAPDQGHGLYTHAF